MLIKYRQRIAKEIILLIVTLLIFFIIVELYYRIFDPFPYFAWWETNNTEYGNLMRYDEILGWSGVPQGKAEFITSNSRTSIENNESGFRDMRHNVHNKEAIVFLRDSFTWGYEVDFNEMFVNVLRKNLPRYEIFNLSQRGYGTDQELLAFKQWHYDGLVKFVILMFTENDFEDNASAMSCYKPKPRYEIRDGKLILTNIPVPLMEEWQLKNSLESKKPLLRERFLWLILQSHFIHDIYYRARYEKYAGEEKIADRRSPLEKYETEDALTAQIIKALNDEVALRGAKLVVVAIPSKLQFMDRDRGVVYQARLEKICRNLKNVDYLDLAPYFKKSFFRLYFRIGMHVNRHGNRVIANAIYSYVIKH